MDQGKKSGFAEKQTREEISADFKKDLQNSTAINQTLSIMIHT